MSSQNIYTRYEGTSRILSKFEGLHFADGNFDV